MSILGLALAAVLVSAPIGAATVVGQLGSAATMDGTAVPAGTTILSPAVVESGEDVVIVHLANGGLLALDSQSEVRLLALEEGSLQVATGAGYLSLRDVDGALMTVGAASVVSLDPHGQIDQEATKLATSVGTDREARRLRRDLERSILLAATPDGHIPDCRPDRDCHSAD